MSNETLRIIGSVSSILTIALGALILLRNPLGDEHSISHHIVTKRHYFLAIGGALTIFGALYYAFIIRWFIPQYGLPSWLLFILAGAFIAQMLVAWIPANNPILENNRFHGLWHTLGGIVVASAMVICLWSLAVSGDFNYQWQRTFAVSLTVICSALYVSLLGLLYGSGRFILIVESLFIAIFSIGMLILTWFI